MSILRGIPSRAKEFFLLKIRGKHIIHRNLEHKKKPAQKISIQKKPTERANGTLRNLVQKGKFKNQLSFSIFVLFEFTIKKKRETRTLCIHFIEISMAGI